MLLLLLPSADADPARRLPQEAYVWQRAWSPALEATLERTAPLVDGFRVLVAEWSLDRHLARPDIDWPRLRALHRPLTAVLRLDGRATRPVPAQIRALLDTLPGPLAGIELDHDCPTAGLSDYRRFLLALRPRLPRGMALSITVLPDWLTSPAFPALSRAVDRLVLQVHAADAPGRGLFDPQRAVRWAWAMQRRSARPFLLSLPAYSVRVVQDRSGRVLSTEAERPALAGQAGIELAAPPVAVAATVQALERDPPPGLVGLAWFRVPLPGDVRAWSWPSWQAVLSRTPLSVRLVLRASIAPVTPGAPGVLHVLRLENGGEGDATLPRTIRTGVACLLADGAGPYRLRPDAPTVMLDTDMGMLLRAGTGIVVGWTGCTVPDRILPPE